MRNDGERRPEIFPRHSCPVQPVQAAEPPRWRSWDEGSPTPLPTPSVNEFGAYCVLCGSRRRPAVLGNFPGIFACQMCFCFSGEFGRAARSWKLERGGAMRSPSRRCAQNPHRAAARPRRPPISDKRGDEPRWNAPIITTLGGSANRSDLFSLTGVAPEFHHSGGLGGWGSRSRRLRRRSRPTQRAAAAIWRFVTPASCGRGPGSSPAPSRLQRDGPVERQLGLDHQTSGRVPLPHILAVSGPRWSSDRTALGEAAMGSSLKTPVISTLAGCTDAWVAAA